MATRRIPLALVTAAALAGCVQDDGSRFNPIDAVIPSWDEDQQRQQGMDADRELQKHVTVIYDPVVAGFLNDLGQQIVSTIEPQPFIYRFRVIQDKRLNAFALPGGYVYFHSGTLLAASSIDELAGVMGHEIAHVKARHHLRMAQKAQAPAILAGLAGMAAAMATREPGAFILVQAVNVAVQLRFSREFESEADRLGEIFTTRAGYRPEAITRFFERILEESKRRPEHAQPYLYTHPEIEERIVSVRQDAESLRPSAPPVPDLSEALAEAQARLALLVDSRRKSLPSFVPAPDRSKTDPLLREAAQHSERGNAEAALLALARAEAAEPKDPRVPYRIGELLFQAGRYAEAVNAYRRTVHLDPSRALVFHKLGLAYRNLGDRHRAVYAFEQAVLRAGEASVVRRRAEWEVEKLTFSIVREDGFADGFPRRGADTPAGASREVFHTGDRRIAWWARLGPHFVRYADRITVRWTEPSGTVVQDGPAKRFRKPLIGSVLEFDPTTGVHPAGTWTLEARLEDDLLERRTVEVREAPGPD